MKYVDTNYLIRLALWDVPKLAELAEATLDRCADGSVLVHEAVVEEFCFVLASPRAYKLTHEEIYEGLYELLIRRYFSVSQDIFTALEMYRDNHKLDFVDCLLAVKAGGKKTQVLTFDKELQAVLG